MAVNNPPIVQLIDSHLATVIVKAVAAHLGDASAWNGETADAQYQNAFDAAVRTVAKILDNHGIH